MNIIDIIFVLASVIYIALGARRGFVRGAAEIVGVLTGGAISLLAIRLLFGDFDAPDSIASGLIFTAGAGTILFMSVLGQTLGSLVGKRLTAEKVGKVFTGVDRALGTVFNAVCVATLGWVIAFSGAVGVTPASHQIQSSKVLTAIDSIVPDSADNRLLRISSGLLENGFDKFVTPVIEREVDVDAPSDEEAMKSPVTAAAKDSVVRISGHVGCSALDITGTGFVYSKGLVMTNAHVVAGIAKPIVESNGLKWVAKVVAFDERLDVAVLRVDGLPIKPLSFDLNAIRGQKGIVMGYPLGGPFDARGAQITRNITLRGPDVYGRGTHERAVHVADAVVRSGNSGGPLVSLDGKVIGVVFATVVSNNTAQVLTVPQVIDIARKAVDAKENLASKTECVAK
ncbi:MarP family serine protease [Aeromicrobium sp. 179-A 4D2 NHS]|uniref:MarP family serine protease n=1 Tax=Aeromicrobium sp. 179-A 4D2 NHS TaxID=3142375 RepID=UPI0039A2F6C4